MTVLFNNTNKLVFSARGAAARFGAGVHTLSSTYLACYRPLRDAKAGGAVERLTGF